MCSSDLHSLLSSERLENPTPPRCLHGLPVSPEQSLKLESAGVAPCGQAALPPPPQAPVCSPGPTGLPTAPCTCKDVCPSDLYSFCSLCLDVPPRPAQSLPPPRPCQALGCPSLPGRHALRRCWLISNCVICTLSDSGAARSHTVCFHLNACVACSGST